MRILMGFKIGFFLVAISAIVFFPAHSISVYSQVPIELACGQSIESLFTQDRQTHEYSVNTLEGMRLVIYAEARIGNYETLALDTGLWAPNGYEINGLSLSWAGETSVIETDTLSLSGTYIIKIIGGTNTGGAYTLSVNCIEPDGAVMSATNVVQKIQCGTLITNTIARDREIHRYYIYLHQNDQVRFSASALTGNYETLTLDTGLWAPNGYEINGLSLSWAGETSNLDTAELSNTGIYRLQVIGGTSTTGDYDLSVACTLADGTIINPGDAPPLLDTGGEDGGTGDSGAEFSGVGFPGLQAVDFANVAKLPLIEGVPMTGAISGSGGEILGFTFEAEQGDVFDLSYARVSGNLNLGLVVISETNDVVFQTSLVLSETVSTRFTIPVTGQYTVGVFKIDLLPPDNPEPTAFQLKVDLNP
jgi:hypothetical protein